jgi:hypothetical protein
LKDGEAGPTKSKLISRILSIIIKFMNTLLKKLYKAGIKEFDVRGAASKAANLGG